MWHRHTGVPGYLDACIPVCPLPDSFVWYLRISSAQLGACCACFASSAMWCSLSFAQVRWATEGWAPTWTPCNVTLRACGAGRRPRPTCTHVAARRCERRSRASWRPTTQAKLWPLRHARTARPGAPAPRAMAPAGTSPCKPCRPRKRTGTALCFTVCLSPWAAPAAADDAWLKHFTSFPFSRRYSFYSNVFKRKHWARRPC